MVSKKEECTSHEQNNIDNITEGIDSIAILDDKSICASCGKEGNSNDMNTCNKCKSVKYCNAACKKKHRTKHKKACERRMAELHEEALFKDHPLTEECPICMLPMPIDTEATAFMPCCGKMICNGCIVAMVLSEGKDLCAFCRTPKTSSNEKEVIRMKKLIDKGNGEAFNQLGGCFAKGLLGVPQNRNKANELYLKAGEHGCVDGYYNLGIAYDFGRGVEVDRKKAKHYYELAAMNGCVNARHNLGCIEGATGNYDRAIKHLIIAAKAGREASLDYVKQGFKEGFVTKDEYANTLRAYQKRQNEMKSDERDKAAAIDMMGQWI